MIKLELSLGSNSETAQVGGMGRGQGRMGRSADTGGTCVPATGPSNGLQGRTDPYIVRDLVLPGSVASQSCCRRGTGDKDWADL